MKKLTALEVLIASPIIPVIAIKQLKDAVPLAQALVSAGLKTLEITLRIDCALEAIRTIKQNVPGAIVGAGTVTSADKYIQAVEAGSQFIISPGLTESLLNKSKDYDVSFIPGIATASELMSAQQYGLSQLKFFPAEVNGGVKALRALAAPFPDVRFCPTGGINETNYSDYLALPNVLCVGGSWFVSSADTEQGQFEKIHRQAKTLLDNLK